MDEALRGWVEFRDVSFRYAGAQQDALSNISFTAQPGQTTAFIGSTGSGKSTIINLIPRFYDATSGQVLVGGVDVRELAQAELRAHIGYVPQQNVLMAGTIRSNLLYGVASSESGERAGAGVGTSERGEQAEGERAGVGVGAEGERAGGEQAEARNDYAQDYAQEGLTPQEMEQIVEIAQARAFIEELDEGLDAPVAQGGSNVSGGQRQRLAIARALAVKPDIYLFDDSFSALDFATDVALRAALKSYTRTATLIIVAQRVSTIMDADQIIVIDDGRMVGKGTHAELLHSCEAYFEIASSQLAESLVAPSVSTGGQEVSRG
ncbi:MAG: ABC transporter ATP-binding protein/permease [Coriobacteriales bacterium]|nr:ABC transporter ATP-binding protein/permease [Coriobacteriales bacterium]